jgi:SAM-dependent methyltransferase
MTQEENKQFWESRALNKGFTSKSVTDADVYRRELEIVSIIPHLPVDSIGIDIGCGSAYGTDEFSKYCKHIVCSDYSDSMIELAKSHHSGNDKLSFKVENIIDPSLDDIGKYDFAIAQRCLINILNKEDQRAAINNIYDKLKVGGIFIMLEGSQDGRDRLNEMRIEAGLDPMPPVPFNVDFNRRELLTWIEEKFELTYEEYLGTYDYLSRVVYPLCIKPEAPAYESDLNKYLYSFIFKNTQHKNTFAECSRTFLYILKKI